MFRKNAKLAVALFATVAHWGIGPLHAEAPVPLPAVSGTSRLSIGLKPLPARDVPAKIGTMQVTLHFPDLRVAKDEALVRIALIADNVDTVATILTDIAARDADGPVRLSWRDVDLPVEGARDSETGGPTREWFADRATRGPITVTYTVPAFAVLPPRGAAGPLNFRNDGNALSGAGNVFLLMPPGDRKYATHLDWDLSALAKGARGISSLGEGSVDSREPLTSSQLRMSYFMAGAIGGFPDPVGADRFFSAWQGKPRFDAEGLMKWTGQLHERYRHFFGQASAAPYGVFLRFNPVNAGGGTGLYRSFVGTYGMEEASTADSLKIMLSHEMFHTFQPFITDPAGKESSWFGEGLAMFYGGGLPYRFGMISPAQYIADINFNAARYYSNALATLPNSEVGKGFWKDTRIRTLAYDRGLLYFVTIDEAVRKATGGRRSLDDLMLEMLRRERANGTLSVPDWEDVLRHSLGEPAVTEFRDYLAGKMPIPSSQAFGRCFTRSTTRVRRYEVGFDPAVLAEPRRVVRGLVPGSNAEAAGLRNGDEIVLPVPQDQIQGEQTRLLKLELRRGGQNVQISYLPRGEEVDVYQWVLRPNDGGRCTLAKP